jgi:hypothetical protein
VRPPLPFIVAAVVLVLLFSSVYTVSETAQAYQFWKTMETLHSSLDENTWLILSTDSQLLKYLKDSGGR